MNIVRIERRPPMRRVWLDVGKKNVLPLEAVEGFASAIAPDSEAPVAVLFGRPEAFSCGLDNATLARSAADREGILAELGELLLSAISGPTGIVAACAGHAVAAGAMLLLASDVRIGARRRER